MSDKRALPSHAAPPVELTRTVGTFMNANAALPPPKPDSEQGMVAWMVEKAVDIAVLVVAIVNLALVFFDYSYVMLRPQYQRYAPAVVAFYDPYKGIDPYRDVQAYLAEARHTLALARTNPDAPEAVAAFQKMGEESKDLIHNEDAFAISNQRGVLERIKHLASKHMAEQRASDPAVLALVQVPDPIAKTSRPATTAKEAAAAFEDHSTMALQIFWTPQNMHGRADLEARWFEAKLAPLLNRAYYRHFGEDGKPLDQFYKVDLAFSLFFLLELTLRAIWVLGIQPTGGLTFKQRWDRFVAARWMDFAYFLPLLLYAPIISDILPQFVRESLQLVRMFSVGYRMQRLGLINPVQVVQAKVAEVMDAITDLVNVKLLSNYQDSVRQMDLAAAMKSLTPAQREQLTVLIQRNMTMVLRDVLPDVTPQIEKLAMRAARQALEQAPAYQQLKRLPLFGALPERMLPNLVAEVIAGTQVTMLKAINDAENVKLTNEMIDAVTDSLLVHMAEVGTEAEVKRLLVDLLEEQKAKVLGKVAN